MKIVLDGDEIRAIVERTMRRRLALNDHYVIKEIRKPSVYSDDLEVTFEHKPTVAKAEAAAAVAAERAEAERRARTPREVAQQSAPARAVPAVPGEKPEF